MRQSTIAGLGIAASMIAWQASPELPMLARGLAAFLVGVVPAFSVVQARAVAQLEVLPSRSKLYVSTMITLWGLAFATAVAASESRMDPRLLGVTNLAWPTFFVWFVVSLLGVAAIIIAFKAFGVGETPMIHHMIPVTRLEKGLYAGVSVTAGICEELVFRGFLIAALIAATGSVPLAVIIAAGTFGIAHAHQDAAGALRAGLLGLVLTVPLLAAGSLYPGIAAHALIDLVAGFWGSKWMLKS